MQKTLGLHVSNLLVFNFSRVPSHQVFYVVAVMQLATMNSSVLMMV